MEKPVMADDPSILSAQDDFPLWSAPFGLVLLDHVQLKPKIKVLDVGFGSGFPLLELAQRLGDSSTVYGIDPLKAAHERTRYKMNVLNVKNVQLVQGDASSMVFQENTFDLIVSNLGINNFDDPQKVFAECYRVARPRAQIALTTNPKGHMDTFYSVFAKTLRELRMADIINDLAVHIDHRLTQDTICDYLEHSGFKITGKHQDSFRLRFLDGSAFLNHSLIRYGFLDEWKWLVPARDQKKVFKKLEENLNRVSERKGELELTIPIGYVEGNK